MSCMNFYLTYIVDKEQRHFKNTEFLTQACELSFNTVWPANAN